MGLNDFLKSMFGSKSDRDLKKLRPILQKIKQVYPTVEALSNDELRARVTAIRQEIQDDVQPLRDEIAKIKVEVEELDFEKRQPLWDKVDKLQKEVLDRIQAKLDEVLPEVFAIVKDTARRFAQNETIEVTATDFDRKLAAEGRDFLTIEGDKATYYNHWVAGGNEVTWDMIHYDVQLIGGIVLHQGKIAEMATGEGKTLVGTLPVFLNALSGNGVHMVTVNDYLAKRDSEWMGPLYMFHGISVACIDKTRPNSKERRDAYNCDITFGTNSEFGFDYLRDNMCMTPEEMVQRPHNFAIVDEVDSVLIDDARTPLIISGPVARGEDQMFNDFKPNVERVYEAQRRLVTQLLADSKRMMASDDDKVFEEGALLLYRAHKGLPKYKPLIKYLSEEGVKQSMMKIEAKYMQDNSRDMHIVTDPLYFIIEEQNNTVELTDKGIDVLTKGTEDPLFFVLPDIASELSAVTNEPLSDEEKVAKRDQLLQNYSLKAERVHTVTQLLKAYTLFNRDDEYIVDEEGKVKIVDEQTGRIMEGRRYSDGLHQAIEAKEGVNVEAATQTFATITLQNYFRMYHKLAGMTGTAETEAGEFWEIYKLDVVTIPTNKPVLRNDMPDRVYKTQKEKFNAVIAEIEKMRNSGRPTLVGTTSVEISEMLSRMLRLRHIPHQVLNAKLHQQEADIVAQAGQSVDGKGVVTIATNMAGRGTDIKLSKEVKDAGGLAIIGTERHESRRVDRQLRGRAGRQGDPGSSVFYVSLEDKLMRLFASERIAKVMDRLGFEDGERIESPMISKSIERAQRKVEENNFGIRKHLLEYDDVMNRQRTVIYEKRRHALMGERIGMDIANIIWDRVLNIVNNNDFTGAKEEFLKILAMEIPFTEDEYENGRRDELAERAFQEAMAVFKRKTERIQATAMPIIKQVYENQGTMYERIMVPITDGKRMYNIACNLKEAYESEAKSVVKEFEKNVVLQMIDDDWKENLRKLDELRHSVQNASYEQKDPLLIFKLESAKIWDGMINDMYDRISSILMRGQIPVMEQEQQVQEAAPEQHTQQNYVESKVDIDAERAAQEAAANQDTRENAEVNRTPYRAERMPRPNDPCPCGSGKKFKNCHGRNMQA